MNYQEYALKILREIGINMPVKHTGTDWDGTEPVEVNGVKVRAKVFKYGNCDETEAEVTFTFPEDGVLANAFINYCADIEGIKKFDGHYGLSNHSYAYSPWNDNYLCVRSKKYTSAEVEKAVEDIILLSRLFAKHLWEYSSLKRWSPEDAEVIAKAKEIVQNADFEERDCDREEKAHWLVDKNSFIKGWFSPFNDRGNGTFDTLWPSSLDYAASVMGLKGSFEYAVACRVLEDPVYIRKARKACRIRKETTVNYY